MPYKKFHLYLPAEENFHIEKSIRIYSRFLDGLANNDIEYPNYNHYTEDPNNRITFRADMSNETFTAATQIAEALRDEHEIHHFTPDEANPPIYVKSAHELASRCALAFYNNRDSFIPEINRDALWFTMNFFKLSIERIGYDFYITWDLKRHYQGEGNKEHRKRLETLVNSCEGHLVAKRKFFQNPDFIERFVHLFFNCLLVDFEKQFWQHLSRINTIKSLGETFKENDE